MLHRSHVNMDTNPVNTSSILNQNYTKPVNDSLNLYIAYVNPMNVVSVLTHSYAKPGEYYIVYFVIDIDPVKKDRAHF